MTHQSAAGLWSSVAHHQPACHLPCVQSPSVSAACVSVCSHTHVSVSPPCCGSCRPFGRGMGLAQPKVRLCLTSLFHSLTLSLFHPLNRNKNNHFPRNGLPSQLLSVNFLFYYYIYLNIYFLLIFFLPSFGL